MATTTLPRTTRIRAGYYSFDYAGYRVEISQVPLNDDETVFGWDWTVCDPIARTVKGRGNELVTIYSGLTCNGDMGVYHFTTKREAIESAVAHLDYAPNQERIARLLVDTRFVQGELEAETSPVAAPQTVEQTPVPAKQRKSPTEKRGLDFKPFETQGRFMVCDDGGWLVVDNLDSTLLRFENEHQAQQCATDARAYVKRHGDIDFLNYPFAWDQRLTYAHADEWDERERAWYYGDNLPAFTFDAVRYPLKTT